MSSNKRAAAAASASGSAPAAPIQVTKELAAVAVHHVVVAFFLLRALTYGSFVSVVFGAVFGILACELTTAAWTFIVDNYGSDTTKLVGPVIALLRKRKAEQLGNYVDNAWVESIITLAVLYLPAFLLGFGKGGFTGAYIAAAGLWGSLTRVFFSTHSSSADDAAVAAAVGPTAAPAYKLLRAAHAKIVTLVVSQLHVAQLTECVVYYVSGVIAAQSTLGMVEPARENRTERTRHLKWLIWYRVFDWMTRRQNLQLRFMNWGYHVGKPEQAAPYELLPNADVVLPKDENLRAIDTTSLQLYLHLINGPGVDITGKDVVEVSSGKGGGLSCIAASGKCKSCTGIDLCEGNIDYCKTSYKDIKNLTFKFGDAMGNPGVEADIVLNVEASHCYPSRAQFFKSVFGALRKGGRLLMVDFMYPEAVAEIRAALTAEGMFEIEKDEDITTPVLAAMDKTDQPKRTLIDKHVPKWLVSFVHRFAATKESMMYVNLGKKEEVYHLFQARKL